MKLSQGIRKGQAHLAGDNTFAGHRQYFSCLAVHRATMSRDMAREYGDMLAKYGFAYRDKYDKTVVHLEDYLPNGQLLIKHQAFRLHMMELMACIAEDEGN